MTRHSPSKISRKRRRLFAFVAVMFGVLVALLSAEIALRFHIASRGWTPNCYVTGLVFFVPDARSGHTLRPNLRLKSSTYDVRVNDSGFRGPAIDVEKAPGMVRIAVLGGSSVFGYLVPEAQDSCRRLEQILNEKGIDAEVINAGVPGFNMTQCRFRYEDQVRGFKPDFVILYLGWNDARYVIRSDSDSIERCPPAPPWSQRQLASSALYGFLRYRVFPKPMPQFAPPSDVATDVTAEGSARFTADYRSLIETIQESGATPLASTQVMAGSAHCEGLDQYLGSDLQQIESNKKLSQWISSEIRSTAAAEQVRVIDCTADLACNQTLLGDAIHLTREGHDAVAVMWAEAIISEIQPDNPSGQ